MEIRSQVKALNYFKKLLLGDTERILPFNATPQKGVCPVYNGSHLPVSTPEKEGVASKTISDFILELTSESDAGLHSLMIIKNGKIISRCACAPYSLSRWHVTHSMCKSLTGTAIGLLCDEGLLRLDEKICDIFPEKCTLLTSKRTRSLTVEHLLTMRSGVVFKELGAVIEKDWIRAFLEADVAFEPGRQFDYNSMNSYILSAIVTKKTGKTLTEYLRPLIFEPLGFGPLTWETCPLGITKGGWGLYIYLEDMAKLGLLYLQNGIWQGKQILSSEYINKAIQAISIRENNEEYGYHIWVNSSLNSFMFNGMFGQYVVVFPQNNLIIAFNSGNGHLFTQSYAYSLVCKYFSKNNSAIIENTKDYNELCEISKNLIFSKPYKASQKQKLPWFKRLLQNDAPVPYLPQKAVQLNGVTYVFNKNNNGLLPIILQCTCDNYSKGIARITFETGNNVLFMVWCEGEDILRIALDFEKPHQTQIVLNGIIWDIGTICSFSKDEDDNDVLKISVCFLESSSTRLIKFFFTKNGVILKLDESPAVALTMEKIEQEQIFLKNTDPAFFKDFDYIEYKINKICAPILKGTKQK